MCFTALPLCYFTALLLYRFATLPLYRFTALPLYRFTALPLYRFTALPLYRFTALPLYRFTALPLYRFTALPLYRLPLYRFTALPLYRFTALPLYRFTALPLYRFTALPLYLNCAVFHSTKFLKSQYLRYQIFQLWLLLVYLSQCLLFLFFKNKKIFSWVAGIFTTAFVDIFIFFKNFFYYKIGLYLFPAYYWHFCLNKVLKSSDMRFAAKRRYRRYCVKSELVLSTLFRQKCSLLFCYLQQAVQLYIHYGPASYIRHIRRKLAINIYKKVLGVINLLKTSSALLQCGFLSRFAAKRMSELFRRLITPKTHFIHYTIYGGFKKHGAASYMKHIMYGPASYIRHIRRKPSINISKKGFSLVEVLVSMGVLMIIATGSLQLISYAIKKSNVGLSLVTEQELRLAIGDALYNTNKNPNKCKNNLVLKSGDESKVEKIQALPDSIKSGEPWNKTSRDLLINDIVLDVSDTCMVGSVEHTACYDESKADKGKADCEKKHKSATDCTEDTTNGTAGTWEQNTSSRRRTLTVYFTRAKAGGFKTKLNKVCDPQDNKLGGCYSVQCVLRDYKLASGMIQSPPVAI